MLARSEARKATLACAKDTVAAVTGKENVATTEFLSCKHKGKIIALTVIYKLLT